MKETKGYYRVCVKIESKGDFNYKIHSKYVDEKTGNIDVIVSNIEVAQEIIRYAYRDLANTIDSCIEEVQDIIETIIYAEPYVQYMAEYCAFETKFDFGNKYIKLSINPVVKREYNSECVSYYNEFEYGVVTHYFKIHNKDSIDNYRWDNIRELAVVQNELFRKRENKQ